MISRFPIKYKQYIDAIELYQVGQYWYNGSVSTFRAPGIYRANVSYTVSRISIAIESSSSISGIWWDDKSPSSKHNFSRMDFTNIFPNPITAGLVIMYNPPIGSKILIQIDSLSSYFQVTNI